MDWQGDAPTDEKQTALLGQAVRECAANVFKHAEGNTLTVRVTPEAGALVVTIANNGKPPAGPIAETGGLRSIRTAAERIGASVTVQSAPAFLLTIRLPR